MNFATVKETLSCAWDCFAIRVSVILVAVAAVPAIFLSLAVSSL